MSNHRRHYQLADNMITHLNTVMNGINDPFISSRYVGFVSIAAVTVYELAIKEIFIEFSRKKHRVFGSYAENHFDRINGRIKNTNIKNDYIKKFGDKYLRRYNKKLDALEKTILVNQRISLKSSYANLITWRNQFAHEGQVPHFVNYQDVVDSYELGKKLIDCVAETMNR